MGLLNKLKSKVSKSLGNCTNCGTQVAKGDKYSSYEMTDNSTIIVCENCTPMWIALKMAGTIIRDEKRDLKIEELRKFAATYTCKGGLDGFTNLNLESIINGGNLPQLSSRFDSYIFNMEGSKARVDLTCTCPHCKKTVKSAVSIESKHIDQQYGDLIKSTPKMLHAFFYINMRESVNIVCNHCSKQFTVFK